MTKKIKPFKQSEVLALPPKPSVYYKAIDNHGLYVRVRPTGKSWVRRSRGDARSWQTLGDVGTMTMAMASSLTQSSNVAETQKDTKEDTKKLPIFSLAAAKFIEDHTPTWKNEKAIKQWTSTLTLYAYPVIGKTPINEITSSKISEIMTEIGTRVETAKKVRGRIEQIINANWAVHNPGVAFSNPASKNVVKYTNPLLAKPKKVVHRLAVPVLKAPQTFKDLMEKSNDCISYSCLCFCILTVARSAMAREARWDQIEGDIWTLDEEDMKTPTDFDVPLSRQALELLLVRKVLNGKEPIVFPSIRDKVVLSDNALLLSMKRTYGQKITVHGWRSTFKDWATLRKNGADNLVSEFCLAHMPTDKVEAAYLRTTLMQARRDMLQDWADFLTS